MSILDITRVTVLVTYYQLCHGAFTTPSYESNAQSCADQAKTPYFDVSQVVGKPWRIYYTWNVEMNKKCLDLFVKNATDTIVDRIWNDMHEYLEKQPQWTSPALYTALGPAKHELLLFADKGAAGKFLGVPNLRREESITPVPRAVSLFKFFIKLVHHGKYLLMMDCKVGIASLLSRERPPYRVEIASVANSLQLGKGAPACINDKRTGEQFSLE